MSGTFYIAIGHIVFTFCLFFLCVIFYIRKMLTSSFRRQCSSDYKFAMRVIHFIDSNAAANDDDDDDDDIPIAPMVNA